MLRFQTGTASFISSSPREDLVDEHFTASGTHRGEVMGVAPTRRTLSLRGINIFRVRDGRITERWGRLDDLGFLQQLGVLPPLGR